METSVTKLNGSRIVEREINVVCAVTLLMKAFSLQQKFTGEN